MNLPPPPSEGKAVILHRVTMELKQLHSFIRLGKRGELGLVIKEEAWALGRPDYNWLTVSERSQRVIPTRDYHHPEGFPRHFLAGTAEGHKLHFPLQHFGGQSSCLKPE